jgi:hypothetical protein
MDAFDTARLGFIQHLWHDVAWLYLTPSTQHGLVLFNTARLGFIQHPPQGKGRKEAQHKVISTTRHRRWLNND